MTRTIVLYGIDLPCIFYCKNVFSISYTITDQNLIAVLLSQANMYPGNER